MFSGLGAGWAADRTINYALNKFFDRVPSDKLTFCYRLMEVSPYADNDRINGAYHQMALDWHPDKCNEHKQNAKDIKYADADCEQKWCELNTCMELIRAEREPDKKAGNPEEYIVADDDNDYDADEKLDKLVDEPDAPDEL